jgi:hypothetical protein
MRKLPFSIVAALLLLWTHAGHAEEGAGPTAGAPPACAWKPAKLESTDGRALPVQLCVGRDGRPTQIQAYSYPGVPCMSALDRLFGFPTGSCKDSYDFDSGGLWITCEGTRDGRPFLLTGGLHG